MVQDIRKIRTCEKCKNNVPLDKVRFYPKDKEKNILVCDACCEEMKNVIKDRLAIRTKPITNVVRNTPLTELSQGPSLKHIGRNVSKERPAIKTKPITNVVRNTSFTESSKSFSPPQPSSTPMEKLSDEEGLLRPKKNVYVNNKIKPLSPPTYSQRRCIRCNYYFNIDQSKIGVTTSLCCPYCGRSDKIEKSNK